MIAWESEGGDSVGVDVTGGDGACQTCVKFFSLTKYTSTPLTHLHPSNYIHPLTLYIYPHTCTHPHTPTHLHLPCENGSLTVQVLCGESIPVHVAGGKSVACPLTIVHLHLPPLMLNL